MIESKVGRMMGDLDEATKQVPIEKVPLEPSEVDSGFRAVDRQWGVEIQSRRAEEANINALQLFDTSVSGMPG